MLRNGNLGLSTSLRCIFVQNVRGVRKTLMNRDHYCEIVTQGKNGVLSDLDKKTQSSSFTTS